MKTLFCLAAAVDTYLFLLNSDNSIVDGDNLDIVTSIDGILSLKAFKVPYNTWTLLLDPFMDLWPNPRNVAPTWLKIDPSHTEFSGPHI